MVGIVNDEMQSTEVRKARTRQAFRERRLAFSGGKDFSSAQTLLNEHLVHFLQQQPKGFWAGYVAVRDEANPSQAIAQSRERHSWAFPVLASNFLQFYQSEPDHHFVENRYGIPEPDLSRARALELTKLNGVLVPGVAFDKLGNRLGQGKAFYDRTLKDFHGFKVGICFSMQMDTEVLPHTHLDVRMDWLVTEQGIYEVKT